VKSVQNLIFLVYGTPSNNTD